MRVRAGASIGRKLVRKASGSWPNERKDMSSVREQFRAKIVAPLQQMFDSLEDVSEEIIYDALEPTFDKSQMYCPELTGELRESGYLEIVTTKKGPMVEIGYGRGGNPDYAVAVHERTDIKHEEPTRAKYLEAAVLEDLDNIRDRIFSAYRSVFNG
jgi:hypothetical protein